MYRILIGFLGLILLGPTTALGQEKASDEGTVYNVPYKLTDTGHVLVRTKINGKGPYNFIIDTGAPILIVNKSVGKELGLKVDKKGWVTLDRFEIEGGVVNESFPTKVLTPFQLEGMNAMNFAGVQLHGIIGFKLLAQYRMEFDFSASKMRWTKLDFTPPEPQAVKVKGGAPDSLNAMASIMKVMSFLIGKRQSPNYIVGGFLGLEVSEKDKVVTVSGVLKNSPAARAGIQKGDQIIRIDDRKISGLSDLRNSTAILRPGIEIDVIVLQGDKKHKRTVTAGKGL